MTDSPKKFAETPSPALDRAAPPDALSEILHTVRLHGDAVVRWCPKPPFHVAVPRIVRVLHIAETAGLSLHVDGRAITLNPGDMALLARGDEHTISSGVQTKPRELTDLDRCRAEIDDSRAGPRWLSGTFAMETDVADPLLSVLPPAIMISADEPGHEWLSLSMHLLIAETTAARPGARVMISRILDLLFIHALRVWSGSPDASPGWLTAAMDSQLGPVLSAVHNDPAHPWTVTELAELARQSRSAFAHRFTELFGQSPAAYVTDRRLDRAAHLLRSTAAPVSKIGRDVGYSSEAAFSRAFQRRFGAPPLRWRKTM